ncbi:mycA [Symbiodinium sp. CCMP2592]|nr:mycA [Symbiodinium sp. CCMP2592]
MLLSNVNILDVFVSGDVGDDGYYTSYEEPREDKFALSGMFRDIELDRIYRQQRASLERRSTLFTSCAIVTLVFCMMLTAAVALFYWRRNMEVSEAKGIRHVWIWGCLGGWGMDTMGLTGIVACGLHVYVYVHVSEDELSRWSVATLKEAHLQTMPLNAKETQLLLRSGVAIEKAELVQAVCLANYESGMHSGFTGEEVREATVVPAIPSKYTEVVEVQTLAGTKVGTTRLPLNASVRTLRDEIQRWQRPKEGAYEDPEMKLLTGRSILDDRQPLRSYCTYSGEPLVVTAVKGKTVDVAVQCGQETLLMSVSTSTTVAMIKDQLCDDLGWDVSLARLSLLLPLEVLPLDDEDLLLSNGFVPGSFFRLTKWTPN